MAHGVARRRRRAARWSKCNVSCALHLAIAILTTLSAAVTNQYMYAPNTAAASAFAPSHRQSTSSSSCAGRSSHGRNHGTAAATRKQTYATSTGSTGNILSGASSCAGPNPFVAGTGTSFRVGPLAARSNRSDDEKTTGNKKDNKGEENEENEENQENQLFPTQLTTPVKASLSALLSNLPTPVRTFLLTFYEQLSNLLPTIRVALSSFVVGTVLGIALILYPVYQSVESTPEPVMLFETILSDLDRGYVDPVDANKLFETGVSAMLQSLDPYTEFEGRSEARELTESVSGKYGGVGLVISGMVPSDYVPRGVEVEVEVMPGSASNGGTGGGSSKLLPQDAVEDKERLDLIGPQNQEMMEEIDSGSDSDTNVASLNPEDLIVDSPDDDDDVRAAKAEQRRAILRARRQGIRVVNAFEGYAYDYGMRVGDRLVAIDGRKIMGERDTVEDVRNMLRGEPGTFVDVTFLREGVEGEKTVSIPRMVVRISDVKLATLLGKAEEGMGYIALSGFNQNAGREVRNAIYALQRVTEDATGGTKSLQGLILDLRGNPGGLLNSAVDVASLLVPSGSDIVSASGRGFPGILYRSTAEPLLDPSTKLAVLVNGQTASAAEIVSGAVQDLDVGLIVGPDRTFGKGLVQNVETLPYETALKYTVAKYYTPSGRCIQSTNYKEGGGLNTGDGGRYKASKVSDKDMKTFFTKNGRTVKDGGGVSVDVKVDKVQSSALEFTLLRSGVYSDFAALWSKENQLTNNLDVVTDSTYQKFKSFVMAKQKEGEIKLDAVYTQPIDNLKEALKQSGYKGTTRELEQLRANLIKEIERDFEKYKDDIKEDIGQNILARYLPESMIMEIGVKRDPQVNAAVKLLTDDTKFNTLLGRVEGNDNSNKKSSPANDKEGFETRVASKNDEYTIDEGDYEVVFLGKRPIPGRESN